MILQLDLVLDEAWNRTFSLENKYELKDFEQSELGFIRYKFKDFSLKNIS